MKLPGIIIRKSLIVNRYPNPITHIPFTKHFKLKPAFSLIELLTVISIIGILVAAATVSWTNAQQKARDAKRKSDLKSIQQALELYFQDNGGYPKAGANGEISCDSISISWGSSLFCDNKTYLNPLPKDPKGGSSSSIVHEYYYEINGPPLTNGLFLNYNLSAGLENTNDPDACTSNCTISDPDTGEPPKLACDPVAIGRNYCVANPLFTQ